MPLMGTPVDQPGQAAVLPPGGEAKSDAAFKAAKKAAAEKFKENRIKRQKEAYENALKLRDELVRGQYLDRLSAPIKEFVLSLCKDPAERRAAGFGGPSVFALLFGDNPKVGDKITLEQAFLKTYKGKSTLDLWVKRWADKGIIVECAIDSKEMIKTTYTIKALPAA